MHSMFLKMAIPSKGTTIYTTNIRPGEILQMDITLHNVNSIQYFTSIITLVCEKTIMIWILPTVSKQYPVRISLFILTT